MFLGLKKLVDVGVPLDIVHFFCFRYRKQFSSAQTFRVLPECFKVIPITFFTGFTLIMTNKIKSVSNDGQRHFKLI